MTRRLLRDVKDMIADAGGLEIRVEDGGRHTLVHFVSPAGTPGRVTVHKGSNPKRYEDCLRSQLRRQGLTP